MSLRRSLLGLCFLVHAFWTVSVRAEEMVFPGADWEVATPESQGVDSAALRRAVDRLATRVGKDGADQMVIVRRGRMIHQGPKIDVRHGIWSGTKSFTSTVLGLLIDDGKVTLDTRACRFCSAMRSVFGEVRMRHFATMTSGYRAQGDEPRGGYTHGPSLTPFVPGAEPLFTPPGSQYAYWDSAMNEFAHVLTCAAGEPIEDLFRRRIADPIGMDRKAWDWGDFGEVDGVVVNGGSGNTNKHMQISARQLARFGHLFLNQGAWDGKQLISRAWVETATRVHVPADLPLGHKESGIDGRGCYGMNWWVNGVTAEGTRLWPGAPPRTFAASGHNNNKCFVVPEWQMVVVRLGLDGNVDNEIWSDFFRDLAKAVE